MVTTAILSRLRQTVPGLLAVYQFGSTATGTARADSDLDLAVLAGEPLPFEIRLSLIGELSEIARREVDLVDLRRVLIVLVRQVLEDGRLLYARDNTAVAHFETTALARYCALNEERREVIEAITARGSVFSPLGAELCARGMERTVTL